jgi:hypothetical protein
MEPNEKEVFLILSGWRQWNVEPYTWYCIDTSVFHGSCSVDMAYLIATKQFKLYNGKYDKS